MIPVQITTIHTIFRCMNDSEDIILCRIVISKLQIVTEENENMIKICGCFTTSKHW